MKLNKTKFATILILAEVIVVLILLKLILKDVIEIGYFEKNK